jgi:ketosteroid isomerase-like protein
MRAEDLETVRRAYDAFAGGDFEKLRTFLAPDIEWRTTPEVPFMGNYVGLDEFLRGMDEWTSAFEDVTTEVQEMIDAGDSVIVYHRMRGRGRDSGVEVDLAIYQVVGVRNAQLVRMHDYSTRDEALEAARQPHPSPENAEKLRAFWEAWTPGGEMDMSILDPDVIYEDPNLPDHIGEEYRGHEGIARATERWLESYQSLTIELERIVGSGDRLVSIHRGRSQARYTGIEEEGPLAYLWTFRDGKVIHFRSYRDPAEALEAAGLRG